LETYGSFGVRIFFVISGFLITGLLLNERERTGTISLPDFYVRRAYRILPAAYVFMLAMIAAHWHALSWSSIFAALTYSSNYLHEKNWVLGHLWSLSVEEQFYLLWPLPWCCSFARGCGWLRPCCWQARLCGLCFGCCGVIAQSNIHFQW
jgi:peptidoglycan/LPS O-acetylase OafA/YrhL